MVAEFRCGQTANDTFFCFAGNSICIYDNSSGDVCGNCPNGYTKDFSFAHFPTCSFPTELYEYILAILTPFAFLGMIFMGRILFKLRSQVFKLGISGIIFEFTIWAWLLSLYVQNGFFEAGIVFYLLSTISAFAYAWFFETLLLKSIYQGLQKSEKAVFKILLGLKLLGGVMITVISLVLIKFCRDSIASFNFVVGILLACQVVLYY